MHEDRPDSPVTRDENGAKILRHASALGKALLAVSSRLSCTANIEKAKALYPTTRISYERIEPIAELFSDLDSAIDSRADDHEGAEKDPDFGGFHRIEYGLWVEKSTSKLGPVADKLLDDVLELQKRLTALTFPPEKVVGGAAVLMEEVAATKISG